MLNNKKILFIGPISRDHISDGYTNAASNMLAVLSTMKNQGIIRNVEAIDINSLALNVTTLNYFDTLILIMNPFFLADPNVQAVLQRLYSRAQKVYVQLVWETDPLPKVWKWMWDFPVFTGFLAPSRFMFDMISKETKKPVFIIPHFVNTNVFDKINIEEKIKEEIFTVLSIGQWTKRKGHEDTIISFYRALGLYNDCRLIVKYVKFQTDQTDVEKKVADIVKLNTTQYFAPVFTIGNSVSLEELKDLYKQTSLLVYPSRGEGFGLPVAEVMSVGIPIVYIGWSATGEIANAPGNIAAKYLLDECVDMSQFGYEKGSKYAIPCISDLIEAIEYKYQQWKKDKKAYYEETIENYKIIEMKYGLDSIIRHFIFFLENNHKDLETLVKEINDAKTKMDINQSNI
jgi:glycosyltransferase involved in cell wall biosynthesis